MTDRMNVHDADVASPSDLPTTSNGAILSTPSISTADGCEPKDAVVSRLPHSVVQNLDMLRMDSGLILLADFHVRQLNGSEPFVTSRRFGVSSDASTLVPPDLTVGRHVSKDKAVTLLARGVDCSLLILSRSYGTDITVSAATAERADAIAEAVAQRVPAEKVSVPDTLTISSWHRSGSSATRSTRPITAPAWDDIARNYPSRVSRGLTELVAVNRPTERGKLILWHGEPGTGKTTALRALAREWCDWCSTQYISDPERLFADTSYLLEVLSHSSRDTTDDTEDAHWQLIVAEDSDEFLRASARQESSAALGRLLNVSDGILGQGSNTLILLTTNERVNRLHPALTRPGRCLAQIEFSRFGIDEAADWLPPGAATPVEPLTLAELTERTAASKRITNECAEPISIGAYL